MHLVQPFLNRSSQQDRPTDFASLRPKEPTEHDFSLEENHLPDAFMKADLSVHGCCHIIFATNDQLLHLSKAKTWYIDSTFKLVRHPFKQLLTINAFVRKDDHAKQLPLVFVLMSGKKKKEYRKVSSTTIQLKI